MSITSSQIRAAKAMIRWSGEDLAAASGVSLSSIRRVEASTGIPQAQSVRTVWALKEALEAAGVEFIGTPTDNPGVRLRTSNTPSNKVKITV
jgi:transcriptional regulator with XRE-family HTH domain